MSNRALIDIIKDAVEKETASGLQMSLETHFGTEGLDSLMRLSAFLRQTLYIDIDPHFVTGAITVVCPIKARPVRGTSIASLKGFAGQPIQNLTLEVQPTGHVFEIDGTGFDITAESKTALVYRYTPFLDEFFLNGESKQVKSLCPGARSQFCGPTFFDLEDALTAYKQEFAYDCSCQILKSAWTDDRRLYFRPGPEYIMRNSLSQFLKVRLSGGYEVRPEQNVDESHPVDIKVTKLLQPRLMLIEIKWIGQSYNEEKNTTLEHWDSRADAGIPQLSKYLDWNRQQAPTLNSLGYYVIFDGRRKGLNRTSEKFASTDLLHFENIDIAFKTNLHKTRNDFVEPIRMFMRPAPEAFEVPKK